MRIPVVGIALLAFLMPAGAAGQLEVVVDAGVGVFAGSDFAGIPPGPALGVGLYLADWGATQGGIEVSYALHEGMGIESATTQLEFLAVARVRALTGAVPVHVGGKMGLGRRFLSIADEPATADGFVIGPSLAARLNVGAVTVQTTLDLFYETFEELAMYGSYEYGTDEDGLRAAFRVGVVLPRIELGRGSGSTVGAGGPGIR